MEYNYRHGKTFFHRGQEKINLYDIFPKSVRKRSNLKIHFKRYGVIKVTYFDMTVLALNPRLELLYIDVTINDWDKIMFYILRCLIKDIILKNKLNNVLQINGFDTSIHYGIIKANYKSINIKTDTIKCQEHTEYITYTKNKES